MRCQCCPASSEFPFPVLLRSCPLVPLRGARAFHLLASHGCEFERHHPRGIRASKAPGCRRHPAQSRRVGDQLCEQAGESLRREFLVIVGRVRVGHEHGRQPHGRDLGKR